MVPLRSRARFVDSSYLKPLLDTYGEFGVAVVEHAVRRVLAEGGEIDVLSPEAGEGILCRIGAFLRHENPAQ